MKKFKVPDQAAILGVLRQRAEKSLTKAQVRAVFDVVAKYHEHPPAHDSKPPAPRRLGALPGGDS